LSGTNVSCTSISLGAGYWAVELPGHIYGSTQTNCAANEKSSSQLDQTVSTAWCSSERGNNLGGKGSMPQARSERAPPAEIKSSDTLALNWPRARTIRHWALYLCLWTPWAQNPIRRWRTEIKEPGLGSSALQVITVSKAWPKNFPFGTFSKNCPSILNGFAEIGWIF
jgi:hypothetical protein